MKFYVSSTSYSEINKHEMSRQTEQKLFGNFVILLVLLIFVLALSQSGSGVEAIPDELCFV